MTVWKYNDKCCLKVNDKKVFDYAGDKSKTDGDIEINTFTKGMPYILDLTVYRYELGKIKNKLKDIQFPRFMKFMKINTYRMGLPESSLTTITKPLSFLPHCKVSCDSPCCTELCGEDNHCFFNIDTHENVNSDSDSEDEDTNEQMSK